MRPFRVFVCVDRPHESRTRETLLVFALDGKDAVDRAFAFYPEGVDVQLIKLSPYDTNSVRRLSCSVST